MTCFFCKGTMENSVTTHFSDLDSCIAIIKSVPCRRCSQCGEVVYLLDVGQRLEQIVDALKASLTEVAIIQYSSSAA